jgi:hypothetical protein
MPVIEAQRASILVPHDHRHIKHERLIEPRLALLNIRLVNVLPDVSRIVSGQLPRTQSTFCYDLLISCVSKRMLHTATRTVRRTLGPGTGPQATTRYMEEGLVKRLRQEARFFTAELVNAEDAKICAY